MIVLIDTSVWSLAFRRRRARLAPNEVSVVAEWTELVREGSAALVGPIRQEVLSGVRSEVEFERLRRILGGFDEIALVHGDYDRAAQAFNICRRRGIAGSPIDMLICAVALRRGLPLFTTDSDFGRYARHLRLRLHVPR